MPGLPGLSPPESFAFPSANHREVGHFVAVGHGVGVGTALETIFEVRRLSDLGNSGVTKTAPTFRVREVRPATPASSSPNNKQQLRNGRRVTKRRELRDMGAISFFERLPGIQFGRSGTFTNASTAI